MKFEALYRRLLHSYLDELLDVSERVRIGIVEHQDGEALLERSVRKNVFDELLWSYIVANRGKDRVVTMLQNAIEDHETLYTKYATSTHVNEPTKILMTREQRSIALLKEMINAFKSKE